MIVYKSTGFPQVGVPTNHDEVRRRHLLATAASIVLALVATTCVAAGIALASITLLAAAVAAGCGAIAAFSRRRSSTVQFRIGDAALAPCSGDFQIDRRCLSRSCANSMESFQWKKRLIQEARQEVVLSGNYCGGAAFEEILDLIAAKLTAMPNFRACVMGSDVLMQADNHQHLQRLQAIFGNRFVWVKTESYTHKQAGAATKVSNNHVKALVIDGGRKMLLGGSNLEDRSSYSDGLAADSGVSPSHVVDVVLARNYRDMDWVFARPFNRAEECEALSNPSQDLPDDMGSRVRNELLKLAKLYQEINATTDDDQPVADSWRRFSEPFGDCILPQSEDEVDGLDHPCDLDVWAQGPHDSQAELTTRLQRLIDGAQQRIVIHHQYFNPSNEIMDALARALTERNVEVIVTSNYYKNSRTSPRSHQIFVPANRKRIRDLAARIPEHARSRLRYYEFGGNGSASDVPVQVTLHKKVCVIDGRFIVAGSSNLGYKSTVSNTDYEINFVADSPVLAQQTEAQLQEDRLTRHSDRRRLTSGFRQHAKDRNPLKPLGWWQGMLGWLYVRFWAPRIN